MVKSKTMGTTKTAISLDQDLLQRVDAVAEELHEPRSRIRAHAAEEFLRRHKNRQILERLDQAYWTNQGTGEVSRILTFDRGFDDLPGLVRISS